MQILIQLLSIELLGDKYMYVTSFSSISYYSNMCPIYQNESHKPYPELNGGQLNRRARGLVRSNRYMYNKEIGKKYMSGPV